ncbi:immunoglobulin superfamily member 1-like [Mauremys reevesii]|uniref:immunoglobulin superfamily member 1-like n=1 Tax=Mauremys reevesii TaxID=260615 RepID=UPI00193F6D0D|nr:immunoglobulin superfamily member 1-like [Mauremys reevesii]
MASALTVLLLGCWLAGHSGVWGQPSYPKPTISGIPSEGVSLGGSVSIWCKGQHQTVQFVLNKDGRHIQSVDSDSQALFLINNLSREHGGNYKCSYHSRLEPFKKSDPSDPVELVVRDPSLPRPNISLSPTGVVASGADVTIRCQGQHRDVRFFVHKAGDLNPQRHMDPAGDGAKFRIPSVGRQDGGSYSCSYRRTSEPFVSSQPSDPVQLMVAAAPPGHPDFTYSNIARLVLSTMVLFVLGLILSEAYYSHLRGAPSAEGPLAAPIMASALTVLLLCCWLAGHSGVWGQPSYPKPTISGIPSEGVSLGGSVSIWCKGQHQTVQFVLNKDGRHIQSVDSDSQALFLINNLSREHGGNYNCSYHSRLEPFKKSDPSDPVELVVRDPSLPRPSISLSPTGVVTSGADVTIRCQGQRRDVRFFVHKAEDRNPQRHMDPAGDGAEFRIPSVGRQHGGSYSCSYRPPSEPFVSSQPSDTVELVVADPSLPRPNISLSPTGVTPTEADVTIRCEVQLRDVSFFLHKGGDLNPQRHMDPAGAGAEFRIPSVGRQHGGSYSCSYRPQSKPFISSLPSDPVELEVAEPTLPKPSISPSGEVSLGGSVSVRCQGLRPGVRFVLNKGRRHVAHVDTEKLEFVFPINNVQREQGGNYSCSHHSRSFTKWSDPVELVVRG